MIQKLNNLVQFLNTLECDLNDHKNPNCRLTLLTHDDEPSVTYKLNTKLLRMALRLTRRHYVKNRKKDTYYPPGMHPKEIMERKSRENKKYASEPVFIPADVKTITYLDEPERTAAVKKAEELTKAEELKRAEEIKKTSERWKRRNLNKKTAVNTSAENTPAEIPAEENTPEAIIAEEITPEAITAEEITPEAITAEENTPAEITAEKNAPPESAKEVIQNAGMD